MPIGNSGGLPDHADFNAVLRGYDGKHGGDVHPSRRRNHEMSWSGVAGAEPKFLYRKING
jgi:hypothetical protein